MNDKKKMQIRGFCIFILIALIILSAACPSITGLAVEEILITKAKHLDETRTVISDIYEEVKAPDNIWSEPIHHNEYVRVTFEKELDSSKDITLYPEIIDGDPKIEVYEHNGNEIIAEFLSLRSNEYNKVYLTNLAGTQDTFDLKITDGTIEFDYIVDPSYVNLTVDGDTGDCTFITPTTWYHANSSDDTRSVFAGDLCGWTVENWTLGDVTIDDIIVYVEHVGETGIDPGAITLYVGNSTSQSLYGSSLLSDFESTSNKLENSQGVSLAAEGIDIYNSTDPSTISELNDLVIRIGNTDTNDAAGVDHIVVQVAYIQDIIAPNITLNYPPDNYNTSQTSINFNWTATDDQDTNIDCNLTIDGVVNASNVASSNGTATNYTVSGFNDGTHYWNVTCVDDSGNFNTSETRSFTIDAIPPDIILNYPPDNYNTSSTSINFNWTATNGIDPSLDCNLTINGVVNASDIASPNGTATNYTVSGFNDGTHYWNVTCVDDSGNFNTSETRDFTVDTIAPEGSLDNPPNDAVDVDGNITFNCSAADNINLKKIEFYFNTILNQSIDISGTSNNTVFYIYNLADGSYNWSCRAYDNVNNFNQSVTRNLTVNISAVPVYNESYFSGNTTDWSAVPDITNVSNAILDDPPTSMIKWYNNVNAEGADFDTNVILGYNYVEIITPVLHSSFNSSAELTMRNLTYDATPLVLRDGILCNDTCSNVSYVNGTAIFNVTHFTNFTVVGNAQLEIWDQTDSDKDNLTKYPYQQIGFYANYTKKTDDQPILGATCTIDYTDSTGNTMTYNATSTLYEYNRSFTASGIKNYNITCTAAGFQTVTLSDFANVSIDNINPNVTLNYPPDNYVNDSALYINITFNCSATDNIGLSNISLYITNSTNESFSLNQTTALSGISDSAAWNLTLGTGNYTWNCLAYDLSGNPDWGDLNRSIKLNYSVVVDNPPYWSNNQSNIIVVYSPVIQSYFNITWQDDFGISTAWFESNYSGGGANYSMNNITGDIYNYSAVLPAGTHYWKSYANDTANQWNSTDTWSFTINKSTTVLSLIASPSWSVFNGTQTNVSCYANNAVVNISLYRNDSLIGSSIGGTVSDVQTLAVGTYNYTCNTTLFQHAH
jgi:hypothetical protein